MSCCSLIAAQCGDAACYLLKNPKVCFIEWIMDMLVLILLNEIYGILMSGHARDVDNRETMRQNLEIVLLVDTETFNVRGGGWLTLSNLALTSIYLRE